MRPTGVILVFIFNTKYMLHTVLCPVLTEIFLNLVPHNIKPFYQSSTYPMKPMLEWLECGMAAGCGGWQGDMPGCHLRMTSQGDILGWIHQISHVALTTLPHDFSVIVT